MGELQRQLDNALVKDMHTEASLQKWEQTLMPVVVSLVIRSYLEAITKYFLKRDDKIPACA